MTATEMKKIALVLLAFAATLSLASCVKDVTDNGENGKDVSEAENVIAFTLASQIETRSAESAEAVVNTYSLGDPIDGQQVYLEETVTSLDEFCAPEPETKGTPVYTQNFKEISGGSFTGLAFRAGTTGGEATDAFIPEGSFTYDSYWNKWIRMFDSNDPFGTNEILYFFMRVPATVDNLSNLKYTVNNSGRCIIDFDYTVASTATEQKDLIFAGRPVSKEESHNAPILFHHALTGIKFATAHDNTNEDVKTYITKVSFPSNGIYGKAHFKITTSWETGDQWVDDPTYYSSARAVSVSNQQQLGAATTFSQVFGEDEVVTFSQTDKSFENNGEYPGTFASAGNTNNLNDADASKTFWLIPQKMIQQSAMDVTFYIISGGKRSETVTRRINLYDPNKTIEWKAGELRTFTLKANEIDVVIEDKIESGTKKNVTITNVGNVPEYIRAQIVGNWFGKKTADEPDGIALGYVTTTEGDETYLSPWALGEMDASGKITEDNFNGTFTGLPGENWIYDEESGFFYFTELVPPGTATKPIFTTFTPTTTPPSIYYINRQPRRVPFIGVHLVVTIPAQAVEAPLAEGSTAENPRYKDYKEAWAAAGVTAPDAPNPSNTTNP